MVTCQALPPRPEHVRTTASPTPSRRASQRLCLPRGRYGFGCVLSAGFRSGSQQRERRYMIASAPVDLGTRARKRMSKPNLSSACIRQASACSASSPFSLMQIACAIAQRVASIGGAGSVYRYVRLGRAETYHIGGYAYGLYGTPDWKQNRESSDPSPKGRLHIWRAYDYPNIFAMYLAMPAYISSQLRASDGQVG